MRSPRRIQPRPGELPGEQSPDIAAQLFGSAVSPSLPRELGRPAVAHGRLFVRSLIPIPAIPGAIARRPRPQPEETMPAPDQEAGGKAKWGRGEVHSAGVVPRAVRGPAFSRTEN